ncbi:formate dehydrogenase subunit alpha [Aureivirga sp. CE67]|uniref:formate dehydrogenase subunit alpha n=1 Tax=Aureivirga sp. CE67 TaxID=1788983 RepID=UPI0018C9F90A|nr:formate dehydrogenase subunit alpha [Aureivirga sp. CE67]
MEQIAYINNIPYPYKNGETILNFVKRIEGEKIIPTLCDAPNLEAFGSCRVCSVEVALEKDGKTKTVASCHTPVMANSFIYPNSESIQELRKNIIELVLTDHPMDCLTCEVNGNCELQDVAASVGITEVRYPEGENHLDREKDLSHPYMLSDLSKCINCYRCVRACDEVQGEFVLSMAGRGFDAHIIKGNDESFMDSPCVSCGACSQACPTSAISDIFQSKSIQATEKTRTVCTYCGVGCNLDVSTKNGKVLSIQAPYDAEVNQGHTCIKGRYAFKFYDHPDRLRSPMIKRNGEFEEVSWEEAYDYITDKFKYYKEEFGPDSLAGISSSRCTNEENYLMQKFYRAVIQTNNIDGCARVCHSPTALGMQRTFGTGAATNSIKDLKDTNCIMVIGANPTSGHPVTGAKMKQFAMKQDNISIVIDPRKTELARHATYHLPVRPGTNVAVLNMMMYYIVSEGLVDESFIQNRTEGFEEFKKELLQINLQELEEITGVAKEKVREAAIAYAMAPNAMSFHGLGVTEHSQGTFTVMQIADLALMTGNIGRKGVGVNPLRGQNNVQGAADMGVQPHQGAGYLDITKPEITKKYNEFYGVPVPSHIGYKIPEMFDAALEGKLKAIWIIGEDVVQTDPNTQKVIKALNNTDLVIVQELFMTETAKQADVILPGASFLEKSGTFTNGERRVQRVNQVVEPIAGTKPDGQIIVDMMNKMGYEQPDYTAEGALKEVSEIVPFFAGITWENLSENGKQWPVAPDGTDTKILHTKEFKRGKGYFEFNDFKESNEIVQNGKEYPYILTTNRDLEHYNCGAMTRRTGNVEVHTTDKLWLNPKDAQEHGISDGDFVCVESPRGKVDIKAWITEGVKPGILSTTFHFPEIMVNNITSDEHCSEAMCPEYKVVSVRIRKSKGKQKMIAES